MRIAVIGASGFIGNNICRILVENGHTVVALLHIHSNSLERVGVEKVRGDILDSSFVDKFCSNVDVVVHAAGKISINGDPDGSVYQVNVNGTRNVVNACLKNGIKRVIYVSSIHALRQSPAQELDESRPLVGEEGFLHDFSKSEAEREIFKGIENGLKAIILNPTAVIGPYDFQPSLMGQGLIALYNRKVPALVAGGFDFIDVRDVAKSVLSALERGKLGERYLLSGMWKTVKELAQLVQEISGNSAPKFIPPNWLARMGVPLAKAYSFLTNTPTLYTNETLDVLLRCNRNINCSKAKRELLFYPRPLTDTLMDTFEWYKQAGLLAKETASTSV